MYGIERQEKILSLLSENVSISVAKLSKLLYVSQPTVRRDLNELERQKKVIRTHGGVVIRNAPDNEIPLLWREEQNNASKKKIAEKAAEYIHNGDIIFMDASSTVSYISVCSAGTKKSRTIFAQLILYVIRLRVYLYLSD